VSITVPLSAWTGGWTPDPIGLLALALSIGYAIAGHRRARTARTPIPLARAIAFHLGCLLLFVLGCGPLTHYATLLFWVRAMQITILLYLVPLALACGTPLRVFGSAAPASSRRPLLRLLRSRAAKILTHPAVASPLLLITPWVLLFTGWNVAAMRSQWVDVPTRLLLLGIGFVYFWSRVQADPVPRRFPQGLSLLLTIAESLGDGILGVTVWLFGLQYVDYYGSLGFTDPDQLRLSQTIGAGMLWLLADVIGLPFLAVLMAALRREDRRNEIAVDAALDRAAAAPPTEQPDGAPTPSAGLWWEQNDELRDRFRR
jgi:cytochrome c oxidase assembly factor CtaG